MKKIFFALICLLLSLILTSCSVIPGEFVNGDFSISLARGFSETDIEGYYICYGSVNVSVYVKKYMFDAREGIADYSEKDFAEFLMTENGITDVEINEQDGIVYFVREYADVNGGNIFYFTSVKKGSNAFWYVEFVTDETSYTDEFANFVKYAGSIKVK